VLQILASGSEEPSAYAIAAEKLTFCPDDTGNKVLEMLVRINYMHGVTIKVESVVSLTVEM
jgi:hypothetical protein